MENIDIREGFQGCTVTVTLPLRLTEGATTLDILISAAKELEREVIRRQYHR